jgi:hypothetical protein
MLYLSEILLQHHELQSFEALKRQLADSAKNARFFRMDVKPPFPDTPENWEDILEGVFSGYLR